MKIRSLAIRLAAFLGGLTGIVPSSLDEFGPVNRAKPRAKARMIDLGPRRDKNRYRPFRLEYPADLPRYPVTRQVMRAELRATVTSARNRTTVKERRYTTDYLFGFKYGKKSEVSARMANYGAWWIEHLSDAQMSWVNGWVDRSGRPL